MQETRALLNLLVEAIELTLTRSRPRVELLR
jgi:hypothetical protein